MASRGEFKDTQTSFAGGEFDQALHGRTDFARYTSGCKKATNFFVSPHGTLMSRAGTQLIAEISGYAHARLVPFTFSDTDNLVLVFADYKLLAYAYDNDAGKVVLTGDTWSPYAVADVDDIKFCQLGDVVTCVHKDHRPYELRRLQPTNDSWSFSLIVFEVPEWDEYLDDGGLFQHYRTCAEAEPGLRFPTHDEDPTHPARPWTWCVTRIFKDAHGHVWESKLRVVERWRWRIGEVWSESGGYTTINPDAADYDSDPWVVSIPEDTVNLYTNEGLDMLPSGVGTHGPERPVLNTTTDYWKPVSPSTYSSAVWSGRFSVDTPTVVYADKPVTIDWTALPPEMVDQSLYGNEVVIIGYRVYRGREGHYGLLAEVKGTSYTDSGAPPDYSTPPPQGTDPFKVYDGNDNLLRIEHPRTVCYYDGRLVFGGTEERPSRLWLSAVEAYTNFDHIALAKDSDALTFVLATSKFEAIRGLLPSERLVVLTDAGEWSVTGVNDVITPSSVSRKSISRFGSGLLEPLDVDHATLFMQRKGTVPRMMVPNENGFMRGFDISSLSRHLFLNKGVVSWTYQEDPYPLIWTVRSDGALLSCAYSQAHELIAWTQHALAGGTALSVCAIPEGYLDSVYVIVERDSGLFLERFASRALTDVRDTIALDSSVLYDGRNTDTAKFCTVDVGSAPTVGYDCTVTFTTGTESAQGENEGLVARVVRYVVVATDEYGNDTYGYVACDVLLHTALALDSYTGELLTPLDTDNIDGVAVTTYEMCRFVITGLAHLEGETVKALVDGEVVNDQVVVNGCVVLGAVPGATEPPADGGIYGAVVCVGLGYNCDFESLKVATERGRVRVVKDVLVETYGSRGGYVGQSLEDPANLEEVVTREVSHEYGTIPLKAESIATTIKAAYDVEGYIGFRQSDPLPVSIIAVARDMEFGG